MATNTTTLDVAEAEAAEVEVDVENQAKVDPVAEKLDIENVPEEPNTAAELPQVDNSVIKARFTVDEPLPNYSLRVLKKISPRSLKIITTVILLAGLIGYTGAGLAISGARALPIIYMEIFVVVVLILGNMGKVGLINRFFSRIGNFIRNLHPRIALIGNIVLFLIFAAISIALSSDDFTRLFALVGLIGIILLCYIGSWNRGAINWRPVIWGFALQFVFALFILRTDAGEEVFLFLGAQVQVLLDYAAVGTDFVFPGLRLTVFFAFSVLPVIIFFAGLTSIGFYTGVLQGFCQGVGNLMVVTLGTSAPESLSAAGNIFLGQTESPLLIRPYLKMMTNSEIHAVMTGGFATIAGGVLASFIGFGVPANHLLSASVMSAPAALAISKIVYPETIEVDDTAIGKIDIGESYTNVIEAFSAGTTISAGLIANIVVNLIGFLALIALLDEIVIYLLEKVDVEGVTFTTLVGYVFSPIALLMGIPPEDIPAAGQLIGVKVMANEFVAFDLLVFDPNSPAPGTKTFSVLTYALCGFSNFSSIGIQLGALGTMAPTKVKVMAKVAFSAMICGNLACFMTACIASALLE